MVKMKFQVRPKEEELEGLDRLAVIAYLLPMYARVAKYPLEEIDNACDDIELIIKQLRKDGTKDRT